MRLLRRSNVLRKPKNPVERLPLQLETNKRDAMKEKVRLLTGGWVWNAPPASIVGMAVGEGEMGSFARRIFLLVGKAFCRSGALRRFLRSPKVHSKPRLALKQVSSVVGHTGQWDTSTLRPLWPWWARRVGILKDASARNENLDLLPGQILCNPSKLSASIPNDRDYLGAANKLARFFFFFYGLVLFLVLKHARFPPHTDSRKFRVVNLRFGCRLKNPIALH